MKENKHGGGREGSGTKPIDGVKREQLGCTVHPENSKKVLAFRAKAASDGIELSYEQVYFATK